MTQWGKPIILFGALSLVLLGLCVLLFAAVNISSRFSSPNTFSEYDTDYLATEVHLNEVQIATLGALLAKKDGTDFFRELDKISQEWKFSDSQYQQMETWLNDRGYVTFEDLTRIASQAKQTADASPCLVTPIYSGVNIRYLPDNQSVSYGVLRKVAVRAIYASGPINDPEMWWWVALKPNGLPVSEWYPYAGYADVESGWISNSVVTLNDAAACSRIPLFPGSRW